MKNLKKRKDRTNLLNYVYIEKKKAFVVSLPLLKSGVRKKKKTRRRKYEWKIKCRREKRRVNKIKKNYS